MSGKILVVLLAGILMCSWVPPGLAAGIGYTLRGSDVGFMEPPREPTSALLMADAAIGRPLGLGVTLLGTGLLVATLPFTAATGDLDTAAWGLVGRPAGWTFIRPLGKSDPRYREQGIFRPYSPEEKP